MQLEDDVSSPEVMQTFYKRLYPFKSIFNWLNHQHAPSRLFTHREFAFTLPGDVYLRYNSFNTAEELKKQVCRLVPSRFEVGAVYNARPRDKKTLRPGALQPLQRELVFDIDMTDYDEIRTCCSGKGICNRCWAFISVAVKVLDNALREHFGFEHLLWVYSGRRGIHCWVSDAEALAATDEQRKAIMGWFEVIKGGKDMKRKVNVRMPRHAALHHSLKEAADILEETFQDLILEDQDCFAVEAQWAVLLDFLPDKSAAEKLRKKWEGNPTRRSTQKWQDFKTELNNSKVDPNAIIEDIMLQYTYPRLDSEVTKHRNHLLKAPFCIHPATGRVCVPVDPKRVDEFNPEKVPTIGQLLRELNELKANEEDVKMEDVASASPTTNGVNGDAHELGSKEWEKTSLKPYVDMLDKHVLSLMNEYRRIKREANEKSLDF